ncbi:MAG: hypothetical protein ACR2LL_09875 [Nitrosopumilus sp.]
MRYKIFKALHHGSYDFLSKFIKKIAPVVSAASSGDETSRKEHIHPRATLMGALGRHSRISDPLVFVTEFVAFFHIVGGIYPEKHVKDGDLLVRRPKSKQTRPFFAFKRTAFGVVHIRTDGNRVLVFTHSGKQNMKETIRLYNWQKLQDKICKRKKRYDVTIARFIENP